jgi:hypothetical protein
MRLAFLNKPLRVGERVDRKKKNILTGLFLAAIALTIYIFAVIKAVSR